MNKKLLENLEFKIGLSGSYWDKKPEYSVRINGVEKATGTITSESNITEFIEFEYELEEGQQHTLEICLLNKTDSDCFVDTQGQITKDMLLNVDSVEIDGIDLGNLKWSASEFVPFDSSISSLKSCVNLGWNGTYKLTIASPFYLWLLDNL